MTHKYDMVSGEWLHERSGQNEEAPYNAYPQMETETATARLERHAQAVPKNRTMPADLAGVSVACFLCRQATLI